MHWGFRVEGEQRQQEYLLRLVLHLHRTRPVELVRVESRVRVSGAGFAHIPVLGAVLPVSHVTSENGFS